MKSIDSFAKAYVDDNYIYGYRAKNILSTTSIYFIPMVNPDGVDLTNFHD